MIIRELKEKYPLVYQAALFNQIAQGNIEDDSKDLGDNFNWLKTQEGYDFWYYVYYKQLDKAKELQPHLFKPIEPSVITNYEIF